LFEGSLHLEVLVCTILLGAELGDFRLIWFVYVFPDAVSDTAFTLQLGDNTTNSCFGGHPSGILIRSHTSMVV
jgi:hypothetical protein